MANEAVRIRQMLCAMRSQVRSDLRALAEDVLQHRFGVGSAVSPNDGNGRALDVQRLKTELALRTIASRYALLSRIDNAVDPPDETAGEGSGQHFVCSL
jgi:hypothetical protein